MMALMKFLKDSGRRRCSGTALEGGVIVTYACFEPSFSVRIVLDHNKQFVRQNKDK